MDEITIKIRCSSEQCEDLRNQGGLFDAIRQALDLPDEDVVEIDD